MHPANTENHIDEIQSARDITLSLPENIFADIIINFLGKKQTLSYSNESPFMLRQNDIEQFHYLLEEKIKKEQFTNINHFTVTIQYNDKTKRQINGISALNNFNETRNVIPIAVLMRWNLVLNFPTSHTIENQVIEVNYFSSKNGDNAKVELRVDHTNPSWGVEVLNLLKDHINSLATEEPRLLLLARTIKNFLNGTNPLSFILLLTAFILILSTPFKITNQEPSANKVAILGQLLSLSQNKEAELALLFAANENNTALLALSKLTSNNEIQLLSKQYTDESKSLNNRHFYNFIALTFSPTILSILLYGYTVSLINYHGKRSFIAISKKSEAAYQDYLASKSRLQHYSISLTCFSIACGVVGNLIYGFITSI